MVEYGQMLWSVSKVKPFNLDSLIESLEECKQETFTVVVKNSEMRRPEFITFWREDYNYKIKYYQKAYNNDLTLKSSKNIKIIDWYSL